MHKDKTRGERTLEVCVRGCQRGACGEREGGVPWQHGLQIYEWLSSSLGRIFLKFPRAEAKHKARCPNPSHHKLPLIITQQPLILHQVCCRLTSIPGNVATSSATALIRNRPSGSGLWYRSRSVRHINMNSSHKQVHVWAKMCVRGVSECLDRPTHRCETYRQELRTVHSPEQFSFYQQKSIF